MSSTTATPPVAPSLSRDSVVDALRSLAIVMMVLSHAARVVDRDVRPAWSTGALDLDCWTQALFLGLAGASLHLSHRSHVLKGGTSPWLRGRATRALELFLLGSLLFFADFGPQWPVILVGASILHTIGAGILVFAPVVMLERSLLAAGLLTAGILGLTAGMEAAGISVHWLNAGKSTLLPNIAWTGVGFLAARGLEDGRKALLWGMSAAILVAGVAALSQWGLRELLVAPLGRLTAPLELQGRGPGPLIAWTMLTGGELQNRTVVAFRPTLLSMAASALLTLGAYQLFRLLRPLLDRGRRNVLLIGHYSLGVYVLHLVVLALVVVLTGRSRPVDTAAGVWVFHAALFGICWTYAGLRHRQRRRSATSATAATPLAG